MATQIERVDVLEPSIIQCVCAPIIQRELNGRALVRSRRQMGETADCVEPGISLAKRCCRLFNGQPDMNVRDGVAHNLDGGIRTSVIGQTGDNTAHGVGDGIMGDDGQALTDIFDQDGITGQRVKHVVDDTDIGDLRQMQESSGRGDVADMIVFKDKTFNLVTGQTGIPCERQIHQGHVIGIDHDVTSQDGILFTAECQTGRQDGQVLHISATLDHDGGMRISDIKGILDRREQTLAKHQGQAFINMLIAVFGHGIDHQQIDHFDHECRRDCLIIC